MRANDRAASWHVYQLRCCLDSHHRLGVCCAVMIDKVIYRDRRRSKRGITSLSATSRVQAVSTIIIELSRPVSQLLRGNREYFVDRDRRGWDLQPFYLGLASARRLSANRGMCLWKSCNVDDRPRVRMNRGITAVIGKSSKFAVLFLSVCARFFAVIVFRRASMLTVCCRFGRMKVKMKLR